jgi:hypothetical protein
MSDETPLMRRMRAAESAVARFAGEPFAWGSSDCVRLVAHVMRDLGRSPPLREAGDYKTLLGARRALKRTGQPTLEAWVDSWGLKRIPPAFALPADIVALPGVDGDMPALTVVLSNGRLFGFLEGVGKVMTLTDPNAPLTAWSVA